MIDFVSPFNPWSGSSYKTSSRERIEKFQKLLSDGSIETTIRESRGRDIMAACGQLKSLSLRQDEIKRN